LKISIVVRARNEAAHLPRLIFGLGEQTRQPDEIILVDSGSSDETVEIALKAGWKVCRISPDEFTFGRSLNMGCELATGDLLVFISAHVYPVGRDYVENLTKNLKPDDSIVVYGRQVGDDRTKFSERMIMRQWFPSERIPDQGHAFANNANACVPRQLWEENRFDESLTGLEDIEFTLRVVRKGGAVRYAHEAPIVHVHEEKLATVMNRYAREATAYRVIFPGESMGAGYAVSLFVKNVLRDMKQARSEGVLLRNFFQVIGFRAAQFIGAYRGFRGILAQETDLLKRMYHPSPSISFDVEESNPSSDPIIYLES
jgi:rhamnosyltransferase